MLAQPQRPASLLSALPSFRGPGEHTGAKAADVRGYTCGAKPVKPAGVRGSCAGLWSLFLWWATLDLSAEEFPVNDDPSTAWLL